MTLIQVAKETGAAVIGIDIDSEAVDLGQRVVNVLAQMKISLLVIKQLIN